ncbi:purple acid phosphatase family protein [Belliella aquatica]|uniref:acid phosphatase n=1 Tax=Belliella aquatica TaxID=1323734 RepID=A0ABQ1M133_9BACT|nr:tartrate-resistant acid phosphatase type 5 family protein [Belliella aquatica]MCH7406890.1 tartrate-resistant acid phosphatase type 5 family protein [Belliella aquatica]GGC31939.1 acid phosphatase [Belliella aquatica]
MNSKDISFKITKETISIHLKIIFLGFSILSVFFNKSFAQDVSLSNKLSPDALNFIVLGDWGRYGDDYQIQVADQLAKTSKEIHAQFFISVGDNFYPKGVASIHDPHWHYSFEDIYKNYAHQKEWYSILGNHDYMGNPDAQVEYTNISRRWVMPGRYYTKDFKLKGDKNNLLQITFIDTNPLIPEFYNNSEYGPNVATQDTVAQIGWLKETLSREDKRWKLVIGHHPMFTASEKRREGYDTRSIRSSLRGILESNKVDAYISGHDHSLQHLLPEGGVHHFISGSASEATDVGTLPFSKFTKKEYGFLVFSATVDHIQVFAISHSGEILYETKIVR